MMNSRREFLKGLGVAGAAAVTGGCATRGGFFDFGVGGSMYGFVAPKLDRIRVGVVGIGARGNGALKRLAVVPGVTIAAICDIDEKALAHGERTLTNIGVKPLPKRYLGEFAWMDLCDSDEVDVIYNCTPWHLHAKIGVYAMEHGKHALIEVPSAMTLDECWELVETAERTRLHCMQLENCCYGEDEMLALNMCRLGIFGQLVHAECGYIHEMRASLFTKRWENWRGHWDIPHCGNQYPTHGLMPVCQYMNVNRGDRLDYLVSLESDQFSLEEYNKEAYKDWRRDVKISMGDMNSSLIKTAQGRSILVQHDVINPRPYTRINLIQGTRGILRSYPLRIFLDAKDATDSWNHKYDDAKTEELRTLYRHPLWKKVGDIAQKVGGHGGMDYLMDYRWSYCLRHGLPLDMDVYDLAATCAVCELSERSVRSGSKPQSFPDFTRGAWKTAQPLGIVDMDTEADFKDFKLPEAPKA